MKRKNVDEVLRNSMPSAPSREAESAGGRVLERLHSDPGRMPSPVIAGFDPARRHVRRWAPVTMAAAAVLVATIWLGVSWPSRSVYARLESADGSLYRIVKGEKIPIRAGERIDAEQTVHSNGGNGAVLTLVDGSRLELRSQAEFSIERAADGIRIRLSNGSLIVNAAKQLAGHLYVQTKDVTVTVVGTVFLVKAEEEGSRVAVIEGEVRVQQGAVEKKLLPGEQMTTNPKMESLSVKDELEWSSQAVAHVALLQQAAPRVPQTPREERLAFEVASIRPAGPRAPAATGARGGGDGANSRPTSEGCVPDSGGFTVQLDPHRLAATRVTIFELLGWAYPVSGMPDGHLCGLLSKLNFISGGAEWLKTEMWDLEAAIPEGSLNNKSIAFSGPGSLTPVFEPKLQQMLQTLLAERFKLVMRRETREVPVFLLKVGKDGPKFNGRRPAPGPNPGGNVPTMIVRGADGIIRPASEAPPPPNGVFNGLGPMRDGSILHSATNVSMENWAQHLFGIDNRPVFDRTGLAGRFDFYFDYQAGANAQQLMASGQLCADCANREMVKAMGFVLEEAKAPFDVWVIERVEKPTGN